MKNKIALAIGLSVTLSISGCFDEKPKTSAVSADSCSGESISSITDKQAREAQSAKCMTSGTYSMPAPKTF